MRIATVTHPEYDKERSLFKKHRLAYKGGKDFIDAYLKRFSSREDYKEWQNRKELTYVPAYAKSALIDIKNAIHQRLVDVSRKGGPKSWLDTIKGYNGGVDYQGNSVNSFLGNTVLDELLPMRKVGIFVDRDNVNTKRDARFKRPYLYIYRTEDIRSWDYDKQNNLTNLLLRSYKIDYNEYGLPEKQEETFLHYVLDGTVKLQEYDKDSKPVGGIIDSDLTRIPFVIGELSQSLMTDIADYQIAAMNLASGDMNYAQKSNYPFYTEQYDPAAEFYGRQALPQTSDDVHNTESTTDGTSSNANSSQEKQIEVGATQGRRYPMNTDRPAFINPSPDPLRVSMEKQSVLKEETRELINLNLSSLRSVRESAESKREDSKGKEEGLSNIGLELEHMERQIAEIWAMYENAEAPTINYPTNYSLKSDNERRLEAEQLVDEASRINSATYQKEVAKEAITLMVGHKVGQTTLDKIVSEIDASSLVFIDPEDIRKDHETGLVSTDTASKIRGYPEGEAEQAKTDHADRLARIAIAQGGLETSQGGESVNSPENQRRTEQGIDPQNTRGEGK